LNREYVDLQKPIRNNIYIISAFTANLVFN
jgi:hypothetical protein